MCVNKGGKEGDYFGDRDREGKWRGGVYIDKGGENGDCFGNGDGEGTKAKGGFALQCHQGWKAEGERDNEVEVGLEIVTETMIEDGRYTGTKTAKKVVLKKGKGNTGHVDGNGLKMVSETREERRDTELESTKKNEAGVRKGKGKEGVTVTLDVTTGW
jgi:hypothetical protein